MAFEWWSRLMQSVQAGLIAAVTTYRGAALAPLPDVTGADQYDTWQARAFRYIHAKHYYWNMAYSNLARYAEQQKAELKLYAHIRPIYNPVFRLVEGYVANVWGGNLDYETLAEGAIPLAGLDEALTGAIRTLWRASNWGQMKNRAVRTGAMLGDSPIKVVPDVGRGKVRLELLDPGIITDAEFDAVGNVKAATISYLTVDPASGRTHTYQERIDKEAFRTYRDGEPYAYPENVLNGSPVAEWPNPYGFVPLVVAHHRDVGQKWGGNAYAGLLPKIDELNDQASKTNDFIRVALNPVWFASGVQGPSQLEFHEADADNGGLAVNVIYAPEGSAVTPMAAQVDIAAALTAIDRMIAELEKDLPELSLPSIRQQGSMTAPGVEAGFADAIQRYIEARGQYDDALVRAHMMGISVGAYHGFEGYEPFSVESYALGHLEHYVKERPVIDDSLSLLEKIQSLQASGAPAWLIWKLAGLSDEEVERAWAEKQATERVLAAEFGRTVISGALAPVDEEAGLG